tara:strand:+ start:175 stop:372 length:198 start_codon:yes stop_codon:yes gene_type:complete
MIIKIEYNKETGDLVLTKDEDLVNVVINDTTIVDGEDSLSFEIAVELDEWNNQFEDDNIDGNNNE